MSNATSCSNPIRKEKYNWQDNPYEQTAQTRSGAPWLWLLLWLVAPGSKLSRRCRWGVPTIGYPSFFWMV